MATRGWDNVTAADVARINGRAAASPAKPRSKYGAVKTVVGDVAFASKGEARRYQQLRLLARLGEIHNLELQPVYELIVAGVKIGKYLADFRYYKADGELVVEDFKGMPGLPIYKLKRRIVEALYGITVTEVR